MDMCENLTLRRVRAAVVAVEKQYVLHMLRMCVCVCSFRYPACIAHEPYCRLWPVWLYSIFPHYFINGTIFWKKKMKVKLKMQVFSVKTQLYYLINQRHVSTTVINHHQVYPKNIEKERNNTVAISVRDL